MKLRAKTNQNVEIKDELVIDRSRWVFGINQDILGKSRMLNPEGNMCCLGFVCHAAGVGTDDMNTFYPAGVFLKLKKQDFLTLPILTTSHGATSSWAARAAYLNDRETGEGPAFKPITTKQREGQLKRHFREEGIKLTFKGRYPKGVS